MYCVLQVLSEELCEMVGGTIVLGELRIIAYAWIRVLARSGDL